MRRKIISTSKSPIEGLVHKQLKVLGISFTALSGVILLVTLFIGVFSVIRIDSIKDDVNKRIDKQDEQISQFKKVLEERYQNLSLQIENRLNNSESRTEAKINRFSDKTGKEVKDAIDDMNTDFENLSGQSLLKPEIILLYKNEPLAGQTIEIPLIKGQHFWLRDIYLNNIGNKISEIVTLRLSFSYGIHCNGWRRLRPQEGYEITLFWKGYFYDASYLAPGESWNEGFDSDDFDIYETVKKENLPLGVECRLEVVYEAAIPLVAEFKLILIEEKQQ